MKPSGSLLQRRSCPPPRVLIPGLASLGLLLSPSSRRAPGLSQSVKSPSVHPREVLAVLQLEKPALVQTALKNQDFSHTVCISASSFKKKKSLATGDPHHLQAVAVPSGVQPRPGLLCWFCQSWLSTARPAPRLWVCFPAAPLLRCPSLTLACGPHLCDLTGSFRDFLFLSFILHSCRGILEILVVWD